VNLLQDIFEPVGAMAL